MRKKKEVYLLLVGLFGLMVYAQAQTPQKNNGGEKTTSRPWQMPREPELMFGFRVVERVPDKTRPGQYVYKAIDAVYCHFHVVTKSNKRFCSGERFTDTTRFEKGIWIYFFMQESLYEQIKTSELICRPHRSEDMGRCQIYREVAPHKKGQRRIIFMECKSKDPAFHYTTNLTKLFDASCPTSKPLLKRNKK